MSITEQKLREIIRNPREHEHVEFKLASNDYSITGGEKQNKRSLYGYCVGIGNSGGGTVLFGVNNDGVICGIHAFTDLTAVRATLHNLLHVTVYVDEIMTSEGRVVIAQIPSRRHGNLFSFYGKYLMRAGEELVEMTQDDIAAALSETQNDFTATYISIGLEALNQDAVKKFRNLYEEKAQRLGQDTKNRLSVEQFLMDLGLYKQGNINNASLLLMGKADYIREHIPNAEIIFEYRVNPLDTRYSDRLNLRDALILSLDVLWEKINSRNFISQLREKLVRRDIPAFNEDVIREAILNAVVHRDYQAQKSVMVRQDNTKLTVENPGGFLPGITAENIYKMAAYRNRRLAEAFEKTGLVERSGQGADLIFEHTIREGKGIPEYVSSQYDIHLLLSALIKDENMISYLDNITREKQITLTVDDLIIIEKIKECGSKGFVKKDVQKFLDLGVVVADGAGRGTKYFLSKQYYKDHGKLGEYTKIRGLGRAGIKELILKHLNAHQKVTALECIQISPNLDMKAVANILQELRKEGKISFEGESKRKGHWVLIVKN